MFDEDQTIFATGNLVEHEHVHFVFSTTVILKYFRANSVTRFVANYKLYLIFSTLITKNLHRSGQSSRGNY